MEDNKLVIPLTRIEAFGDSLVEAIMDTIDEWEQHAKTIEPTAVILPAEAYAFTRLITRLTRAMIDMNRDNPILLEVVAKITDMQLRRQLEADPPSPDAFSNIEVTGDVEIHSVVRDPNLAKDVAKLIPATKPEDPKGWTGINTVVDKDGNEVKN